MIEVYLFHAVFLLQIAMQSLLIPRRLLWRIRETLARYPASAFPQMYPEGEEASLHKLDRYLRVYVWMNGIIGVLGLLVLGRLFAYMQDAAWDDGPVELGAAAYFLLQLVPMLLVALVSVRGNNYLRAMMRGEKRKAVLQRRGLFDFVSPAIVAVTALCYPLAFALVFYIQRNPFPGFGGYLNIVFISFLYAWSGFWMYRALYGRKSNPLQSNEDRLQEVTITVKSCVYSCLAGTLFMMLTLLLALLDKQSLGPLAMTCLFSFFSVMCYRGMRPAAHPVAVPEPRAGTAR